jgi:hypothetical protein
MIEKLADVRRMPVSEFLDPNHPSNTMIPVFLVVAKFARELGIELRRTSEAGH